MNEKLILKSLHIYLDDSVVKTIFEDVTSAFVVYNKEQHNILITPVTSDWFKKMYKPAQYILKARNLEGDKTLALGDIFIDNDLEETDRELEAEFILKTKLIKVKL